MDYGLIGERLGHSFSPEIHFRLSGKPYELKEIPRASLGAFLERRDFKGINVTIPYKSDVIPYLDYISPEAESLDAVNTIVNIGGSLSGFNTDYYGFLETVRRSGITLAGRKVLVLGNGGAAKTVAGAAADEGASAVDFAVRTPRGGCRFLLSRPREFSDYEVVVNATPAGMFPDMDGCAVDLKLFTALEGVIDCVYNPLRTNLLLDAEEMGVPACGGLVMLVEQARRSCEIFHARTIDPSFTHSISKEIARSGRNIVLFGMPASGKTTVGRCLAKELNVEFADTDDLIAGRAGKSIPDIFARDGEAAFRTLESAVIGEVSSRQGMVISVGGGAVLDPLNVRRLRRNGLMVQLTRSLDLVRPSGGRPLMKSRGDMERLYRERKAIYDSVAEAVVQNDGTTAQTVSLLASL